MNRCTKRPSPSQNHFCFCSDFIVQFLMEKRKIDTLFLWINWVLKQTFDLKGEEQRIGREKRRFFSSFLFLLRRSCCIVNAEGSLFDVFLSLATHTPKRSLPKKFTKLYNLISHSLDPYLIAKPSTILFYFILLS